MKVELLTHTPRPEKIVAAAAKLCYSSSDIKSLMDGLTEEAVDKFITKLTELGHSSPLEHCSFTFGVEGVSRSLLAQLTRHRIASYSVKSQRYVTEGAFEFVTPPEIAKDEKAAKIYRQSMANAQRDYNSLAKILKRRHYQTFIEDGKNPKDAERLAEKMAIEDARFVLPNSCETKIVVTMNARELLHFFTERCCNRAQWEIRAMALEMLRLCKEVAPNLFRYAGASCMQGRCKEGKMSCGKPYNRR